MSRNLNLYVSVIAACVAAVAVVLGVALARPAQSASALAVCGSGFGHGVGLSQWGAYGRAEAGQSHAAIIRAYYKGVSLKKYPSNPSVRVLLGDSALSGSQTVNVPSGGKARLRSGDRGASLSPGGHTVGLVDGRYRVRNTRTGKVVGSYRSPVTFAPTEGLLRSGGKAYRGTMTVTVSNGRLLLTNRLPLDLYVRGVVANEMPSSWPREALEAQAVAARSYARATKRSGAFDFYADTRDQVYGGASSETARTNSAVSGTARVVAVYDGKPITAFFSASNGGYSEASAYVFSASPYLKAVKDRDGSGRPYEARADSPWTRWSGTLDADGSPQLGVGNITAVRVLERSPSGRATKIEVSGTGGKKTVSGQYEVRYGLDQNGLRRADGSTYPAGSLPSARVRFGSACG